MSSLKDNKTCALLDQYLSYLIIVKGRSPLTAEEYRVDCNMLSLYIKRTSGVPQETLAKRDFSDVDIDFIKNVTIGDMYDFELLGKETLDTNTFGKRQRAQRKLQHQLSNIGAGAINPGRGKDNQGTAPF